jgi:hypothetical protein
MHSSKPSGADQVRCTVLRSDWHQATVYSLSTNSPEDEELRRSGPMMLCISVSIVVLQVVVLAAVTSRAYWPPCTNNSDQCSYPGSFCEPQGTGLSRCATCGNYNSMGYEWDASTGKIYNNMMTDGTSLDENFGGFNMTTVARICANHSLSVSILGWVPGATCYRLRGADGSDPLLEQAMKNVGPFEDKYEQSVCQGATKVGEASPGNDAYVHAWCSACIIPGKPGEPPSVKQYTAITNLMNNVKNMKAADWITYFFCSVLVAITAVGEIKDIQLCLYLMEANGDIITKHRIVVLRVLALVRRWAFVPMLVVTVVSLVAAEGGSALQICFNSIAILCTQPSSPSPDNEFSACQPAYDCSINWKLKMH